VRNSGCRVSKTARPVVVPRIITFERSMNPDQDASPALEPLATGVVDISASQLAE